MNTRLAYLRARQEFYEHMPRVKKVRVPAMCEGIKWSNVAVKHIFQHGPRENRKAAEGIPEKSKCKRMGYWHFKPLKNSYAREGTYCWTHLVYQGIHADMGEEKATRKWRDEHWDLWVEICNRRGLDPGPRVEG